jgi:autophagy-related protein 9
LALSRGFIPDENRVFDPVQTMREITSHTHYFPDAWKGKEDQLDTLDEFAKFFEYRIVCLAG